MKFSELFLTLLVVLLKMKYKCISILVTTICIVCMCAALVYWLLLWSVDLKVPGSSPSGCSDIL